MKSRFVFTLLKVETTRKRIWFSYKNFSPIWAFLLLNITLYNRKLWIGIVWETPSLCGRKRNEFYL